MAENKKEAPKKESGSSIWDIGAPVSPKRK